MFVTFEYFEYLEIDFTLQQVFSFKEKDQWKEFPEDIIKILSELTLDRYKDIKQAENLLVKILMAFPALRNLHQTISAVLFAFEKAIVHKYYEKNISLKSSLFWWNHQ